jgi:hypothetical protein
MRVREFVIACVSAYTSVRSLVRVRASYLRVSCVLYASVYGLVKFLFELKAWCTFKEHTALVFPNAKEKGQAKNIVLNPDTRRQIYVNGPTFKRLSDKISL